MPYSTGQPKPLASLFDQWFERIFFGVFLQIDNHRNKHGAPHGSDDFLKACFQQFGKKSSLPRAGKGGGRGFTNLYRGLSNT